MPRIDRQAIYERDGGLCGFCGQHVPWALLHLDHFPIPRAMGGPTTATNLRVAHRRCNIAAGRAISVERKSLRLPPDGHQMVRFSTDLHKWLTKLAEREHRSLNSQIVHILEQVRATKP